MLGASAEEANALPDTLWKIEASVETHGTAIRKADADCRRQVDR